MYLKGILGTFSQDRKNETEVSVADNSVEQIGKPSIEGNLGRHDDSHPHCHCSLSGSTIATVHSRLGCHTSFPGFETAFYSNKTISSSKVERYKVLSFLKFVL